MKTILVVLLVTNLVMLVMSASLLDYLTADLNDDPTGREDAAAAAAAAAGSDSAGPVETKRNCLCNGPSCICCVDFNMSFIDLGGPGCVRMHYLSADEGIAINVSYGDSLLHSQTVRGPDPAPTCLNIFAGIAQLCARFSHLLPTDDGLRGCVRLEPKLLGATQLELPIGCFRMGPKGMQVTESLDDTIAELQPTEAAATEGEDGDDTIAGYSAADLLAAVSDSAEEGIALLTNWFGLVGAAGNATAPATAPVAEATNGAGQETPVGATEIPPAVDDGQESKAAPAAA